MPPPGWAGCGLGGRAAVREPTGLKLAADVRFLGVIPGATTQGQALAVRAEDDVHDRDDVPFEGEEFLAGLGIPDLEFTETGWADCVAVAESIATRQAFAVRAESAGCRQCPRKRGTSWPVFASHILIVLSSPPVTRRLPSGAKATPRPLIVRSSWPVRASHTFTSGNAPGPPPPPMVLATRVPSGLKTTACAVLDGEDLGVAQTVEIIPREAARF